MSDLTPNEQYLLELINRARADPGAEAARLGIDLNQGLAPGTIKDTAKQPLAANDFLNDAAADHSQWMLQANVFSHTGQGGSSAGDRIEDAGYTEWRSWGENIAYRGGGNVRSVSVVEGHHDGLFKSSGHRRNLLNDGFTEIGLGQEYGRFNNFNASMVTQNFASDRGDPFLLGVVFDDRDGDDFFDPGEELPGVSVRVAGQGRTTTGAGGGYEIRVDGGGAFTVTFSGGGLGGSVTRRVSIGEENVKLDLELEEVVVATPESVEPTPPQPNDDALEGADDGAADDDDADEAAGDDTRQMAEPELDDDAPAPIPPGSEDDTAPVRLSGDGADNRMRGGEAVEIMRAGDGDDIVRGRGGDDILRGQKGDDRLHGGKGDDKLVGGGGRDDLKGGGGDDVLKGGGGADTLKGGGGDDLLIGGGGPDRFQFTANGGDDTIRGFDAGRDVIEIQSGAERFADLTINQTDNGALVTFAAASILIDGDRVAEADFLFT